MVLGRGEALCWGWGESLWDPESYHQLEELTSLEPPRPWVAKKRQTLSPYPSCSVLLASWASPPLWPFLLPHPSYF